MKFMTHNTNSQVGKLTAAPMQHRASRHRQQGSLLILCVTVLVIIALIGIAFLQRVRLDQAATARHERNYMDLVINGILTEIGGQLTNDVFENAINSRELYDYPWTKPVNNNEAERLDGTIVPVNGAGVSAGPGRWNRTYEDDRWLASTVPTYVDGGPDEYRWMHLTNLTGIWLDLENPSSNQVEQPINRTAALGAGNIINSDTDIPLADLERILPGRTIPLGVDSDMDGVLDSRWQWVPVPVRDFAGRKYIMAVRIVDLSSMVNLNSATPLYDFASATNNSSPPSKSRGYSPTWLDISRLSVRWITPTGGTTNAWTGDLNEMFKHRVSQMTGQIGTIDLLTGQNFQDTEIDLLWEDQTSLYGYIDRNFLADSEMELRRFGGINDTSVESPLEERMPKLLRQAPSTPLTEASYMDLVAGLNQVNGNRNKESLGHWFYGHEDGDQAAVVDRRFAGLRHMFTVSSGVADYVTKYGGAAIGGGLNKFNLRQQINDTQNNIDAVKLRQRIAQAFKLPLIGTAGPDDYLTISNNDVMNDLIREYAMAIEDYSDSDSVPGGFFDGDTLATQPGVRAFGLERLPFLREAYFQLLYTDEDLVPAGTPDNVFETWVVKDDTQGVVIELGNPFAHEMLSDDLNGLIRIVIEQNGNPVGTPWVYNDASLTRVAARDDTSQDDTLLIVSDTSDGTTNGQGMGTDQETELNLNTAPYLITTPDDQLTFNVDNTQISVLLQVDVDPDPIGEDWVTYDRMDTDVQFEPEIPHGPSNVNVTVAHLPQHAQHSFRRNSVEINYISTDTGDGSSSALPESSPTGPGTYSASVHDFQNDNKSSVSGGTWTMPVGFQLPLANQPMRSIAELAWVHMFGFTDVESFSERIGKEADNRHFLLLDPNDPQFVVLASPDNPGSPGAGIPHAGVLMDLFTTLSPRNDGKDNDNDDGNNDPRLEPSSVDNSEELLIPGMINVNTAPLHILTLASPLGESIAQTERLMRMIVSYRDQPVREAANHPEGDTRTPFDDTTGGGANIRDLINTGPLATVDRAPSDPTKPYKPGIGSIGELMFLNPYPDTAPDPIKEFNMHYHGQDSNAVQPSEMDLYPDPEESGTSVVDTGNDNEQLMARFQMLGQTFSVRSDRFVVYAVVRGYDGVDAANISFGAPAETAQFIAVFDRGAMENQGDSPRVIGYLRMQ